MTHEEIYTVVRKWVVANVDPAITVVQANQNAPRPAMPYITILVTTTSQNEHSYVSHPDGITGIAQISNDMACMVSLQSLGGGSKTIMVNLRQTLEKVTVKDLLRADGLPYIRILSGVNDLTEVIGTVLEERAGMDLEFRANIVVTDNVGVIQSTEIEATHVSDTGNEIIETVIIETEIGA